MLMPDVNILVYARRADEAVHGPYKAWLEHALIGAEPLALSVLAAAGFVRIVTNPRIYPHPTPLETALAAVEAVAAHSNCRVVGTDASHLAHFVDISRASKATAKLAAVPPPVRKGTTWHATGGPPGWALQRRPKTEPPAGGLVIQKRRALSSVFAAGS